MIRQITTRLAVYDPSHLYGNGTFWALHDQQDSVASLEALRAQYMATGIAGEAFEDGSLIAGVVASDSLVGIVRVLDGGRDERGRAGRRVLCFLVVGRSEMAGLDLSYFVRSKLFSQIADRVRTGGRISLPADSEIASSVNTKPATATAALRVDAQGEFSARPDVVLCHITQLLKDASKWTQLAAGFILGSASCRGKINVTQRRSDPGIVTSLDDDWAAMTAASLGSTKSGGQRVSDSGGSGYSGIDYGSAERPLVPPPVVSDPHPPKKEDPIQKLLAFPLSAMLLGGGAALLLAGLVCGGVLGRGFRASSMPDCLVRLSTSDLQVTAGESVNVNLSLTSESHYQNRRVFLAVNLPGVDPGSAVGKLQGTNIEVYQHGDRMLMELPWPAKATKQDVVLQGRLAAQFQGNELLCSAVCLSPLVQEKQGEAPTPLKITVLRRTSVVLAVDPTAKSLERLPQASGASTTYQWNGEWQESCDWKVELTNHGPSALNASYLEMKAGSPLQIEKVSVNSTKPASLQAYQGKPIELGSVDVNRSITVVLRLLSKEPFQERPAITFSVLDGAKNQVATKVITLADKRVMKPSESAPTEAKPLMDKPAGEVKPPPVDVKERADATAGG